MTVSVELIVISGPRTPAASLIVVAPVPRKVTSPNLNVPEDSARNLVVVTEPPKQ